MPSGLTRDEATPSAGSDADGGAGAALGAYHVVYDDRRAEVGPAAAIAATLAAATAPAAAGGLPPAQQAALARALVAAEVNRRHPLPRAELAAMCDAAPASLAAVMHAALAARWPAALDGWTLEAVLGRGGFGTVYRARRATAVGEEVVALKRLNPGVEPEPPLAVRHPRVLVPRWTTTPAGETYGTMPLVEGESLADYLSRYRAARALPPLPEVLRLTREMAELLVLVHPHALHRDLKPANVLLDGAGRVSLADFGLALVRARRLRDEGRHERAGTLLYMAPEALLSEREPREPHSLTAAADVWSVGVMLYELLTGEHPFGDDLESLLANVDGALCEDPRVRRPDLPAAVSELCLTCVQRRPEDRPRSAQALLERLRQAEREMAPPAVPVTYANRHGGTEHEPAPFGGRTAELAKLHNWLEAGPEPYALLSAPMGRGKSALCWHFVRQVRARGPWHVVFVPISLYAGTADPGVFLRTLVTHVAQLQGRALPQQATVDEWDRLWREVFAEGVPAGRPVLLVIDGLDEARGWAPDANFLPDLSAQHPAVAARVRVLVAARDPADGGRWQRQLGWTARGLGRYFPLDRLDGPGLLEVFASFGPPLDRLPEPARWQRELLRLTKGEPLLARLYALDLRARALRGIPITLGELADRAPGLDGYVDEWWREQRALWRTQGDVPEVDVGRLLDLLAIARGQLTLEDLTALFGADVGPGRVTEALEAAQRFVVGDGSPERPVALAHPALAEYFKKRLRKPAARLHARYIKWGRMVSAALRAGQLKAPDVPPYLPTAFRYHLQAAKAPLADWDALLAVRWVDASVTATGSYDAARADVETAWDAVVAATRDDDGPGAPRELARHVRCALLYVTLDALHLRVPPALAARAAETGFWSAARLLTYCAAYDTSDLLKRGRHMNFSSQLARVLTLHSRALVAGLAHARPHRLLLEVAVAWVAVGELSAELTEEFVAALDHADTSIRVRLLTQLAARGSVGSAPAASAMALVETLPGAWARAQALGALAPHLPPDLLPRALAAAEALRDEGARAQAFRTLAPHLPPDLLPRALAAAEALGNEAVRAQALGALAPHLPSDLLPRALAAAEALGNERARAQALGALAPHLPSDLLPRALAAAEALGDEAARAHALRALAPRVPNGPARALAAAEALGDEAVRAQALGALAPHLPPDLLPRALAAAEALGNEGARAQAFRTLAPHLPPDLLPRALAAAEALGNEAVRAQALGALAPHLPSDLLPRALAAAEALGNERARAQALGALAPHLPSDLLPRALAAAEALRDEGARLEVLDALAPHLPPDLLPRALAAAKALGDEAVRAHALRALAPHVPNGPARALAAAEVLGDEAVRAQALGALAPHLPPDLLPRALAAAEALRDEGARLEVLDALAPHLPPDLLPRALAAAEALGDEAARAHALRALAPHVPNGPARALAAAEVLGDEAVRAQAFRTLAPHLPPDLLPRALAAAEALGNERARAQALGALAPHLPPDLLPRVLAAAEALGNERARAQALGALAPHLPPDLLPRALAAAEAFGNERARAQALGALAPHLPPDLLPRALAAAEALGNERARAQALDALAPHLPPDLLPRALAAAEALGDEAARLETGVSGWDSTAMDRLDIAPRVQGAAARMLLDDLSFPLHVRLHVLSEQLVPISMRSAVLRETLKCGRGRDTRRAVLQWVTGVANAETPWRLADTVAASLATTVEEVGARWP